MNILFICTGNTCRSPMAEGYLSSKHLKGVYADSCGFCSADNPVSEYSALAMAEAGINISSHKSKQITSEILKWADKIICMTEEHKAILSSVYGEADKISVLGGFGISDPYGGDIAVYRKCRDEIFTAIDELCESGAFSDFTVEAAEEADFKKIAELEAECFSQPWSESALLDAYRHGTAFFATKRDGEILGYIGINTVLDEGYITDVAVFPQYRRQGIASALLKRLAAFAHRKGLSFISLEVRRSNEAAIKLYSGFGFLCEGERKDFYREPREDALILTKRF